MMDRFSPPWFDVRFRGYGSDKVVHINSLNASSFDFKVLPSAFIIHRAHVQTTARWVGHLGHQWYTRGLRLPKFAGAAG